MNNINRKKQKLERFKKFLLEPKDWTFGAHLVLMFIYGLVLLAVAVAIIETSVKLIISNGFLLGISVIVVNIAEIIFILLAALVFTLLAIFIVSLFVSILSNIVINVYTILKSKIKNKRSR